MTALTEEHPASAIAISDRKNLIDVLQFLERRGAAPDVLALAMQRAGIQSDVARLLSRCTAGSEPPVAHVASPQPMYKRSAAERVVHHGMRIAVIWLLLFGSALAGGFALGYELGAAAGWDAGMGKLIALFDRY